MSDALTQQHQRSGDLMHRSLGLARVGLLVPALLCLSTCREATRTDPGVGRPPPMYSTRMYERARTLYSGPEAVQFEVEEKAIDPGAVAIVGGEVVGPGGEKLEGVRVRVHGKRMFGYTQSRRDGGFQLATNGGATLTLA
jgi:hypothetical protein